MKRRYRLYRRNGTFYLCDNVTVGRESLETKNPGDAQRLTPASNQQQRQPALNLHITKAYLAGTDSGITTRTWEEALRVIIDTQQGPTKERWQRAAQEKPPA